MAYTIITTCFVRVENFNCFFFSISCSVQIIWDKELSVSLVKGGNLVFIVREPVGLPIARGKLAREFDLLALKPQTTPNSTKPLPYI